MEGKIRCSDTQKNTLESCKSTTSAPIWHLCGSPISNYMCLHCIHAATTPQLTQIGLSARGCIKHLCIPCRPSHTSLRHFTHHLHKKDFGLDRSLLNGMIHCSMVSQSQLQPTMGQKVVPVIFKQTTLGCPVTNSRRTSNAWWYVLRWRTGGFTECRKH